MSTRRGPYRLEEIPPKYAGIPGIKGVSTVNQLQQLQMYIDTRHRPAFVRIGASTPQSPAILLRQGLKKISDECRSRYGAPESVKEVSVDQFVAFYRSVLAGGNSDAQIAASIMARGLKKLNAQVRAKHGVSDEIAIKEQRDWIEFYAAVVADEDYPADAKKAKSIMQEGLKHFSPESRAAHSAPAIVRSVSAEELLDFFSRIVAEEPHTDDGKRAARTIANATAAETNRKQPFSVWAVEVRGEVRVVRRDGEDPRVAFRWMKGLKRPWNIDAVSDGVQKPKSRAKKDYAAAVH